MISLSILHLSFFFQPFPFPFLYLSSCFLALLHSHFVFFLSCSTLASTPYSLVIYSSTTWDLSSLFFINSSYYFLPSSYSIASYSTSSLTMFVSSTTILTLFFSYFLFKSSYFHCSFCCFSCCTWTTLLCKSRSNSLLLPHTHEYKAM